MSPILGMRIETRVRAGENSGKTLQHDFVALDVQTTGMKEVAGGFKALMTLNAIETETDELAIVAWVANEGQQAPLQAVGGYLASQ